MLLFAVVAEIRLRTRRSGFESLRRSLPHLSLTQRIGFRLVLGGPSLLGKDYKPGIDRAVFPEPNSFGRAQQCIRAHTMRSRSVTESVTVLAERAPVAQLDRVPAFEAGCCRFESDRARHVSQDRLENQL
jgi:hypothetical protein